MGVMLPTLGEERQATYSPFLPISPISGRVLYVPMKAIDAKKGTITFADEDGTDVTLDVRGGRTKLQWKPDFGMRWAALDVDFEMFGKDHQTNAPIYDAGSAKSSAARHLSITSMNCSSTTRARRFRSQRAMA